MSMVLSENKALSDIRHYNMTTMYYKDNMIINRLMHLLFSSAIPTENINDSYDVKSIFNKLLCNIDCDADISAPIMQFISAFNMLYDKAISIYTMDYKCSHKEALYTKDRERYNLLFMLLSKEYTTGLYLYPIMLYYNVDSAIVGILDTSTFYNNEITNRTYTRNELYSIGNEIKKLLLPLVARSIYLFNLNMVVVKNYVLHTLNKDKCKIVYRCSYHKRVDAIDVTNNSQSNYNHSIVSKYLSNVYQNGLNLLCNSGKAVVINSMTSDIDSIRSISGYTRLDAISDEYKQLLSMLAGKCNIKVNLVYEYGDIIKPISEASAIHYDRLKNYTDEFNNTIATLSNNSSSQSYVVNVVVKNKQCKFNAINEVVLFKGNSYVYEYIDLSMYMKSISALPYLKIMYKRSSFTGNMIIVYDPILIDTGSKAILDYGISDIVMYDK